MREIKVDTEQVLSTLKDNRTKHEAEYAEAIEVWHRKVILRYAEVAARAEAGDFDDVTSPLRELPQPEKFLDEYDEAIAQFEWEVEANVTLDEHEFKQFVLNQWAWRGRFMANTSAYLAH